MNGALSKLRLIQVTNRKNKLENAGNYHTINDIADQEIARAKKLGLKQKSTDFLTTEYLKLFHRDISTNNYQEDKLTARTFLYGSIILRKPFIERIAQYSKYVNLADHATGKDQKKYQERAQSLLRFID